MMSASKAALPIPTIWLLSGCIVLAAHAGLAFALLRADPHDALEEAAGAMVIELAPMAVSREAVPPDVAPGPDQMQADAVPTPVEKIEEQDVETQPDPVTSPAEVSLPAPAPRQEQPLQQAPPPQEAIAATTASVAESERRAPVAAAPVVGIPRVRDTYSVPTWQATIATSLERNKRYPVAAQARSEAGTTHVAFTIDREGRLLASRVVRSSGSAALDEEAEALLRRAQPFPAPPSGVPGSTVSLTVPIRFDIR